jgi:hypothetical protein
MKHGPHAGQRDTNPASGALTDFRPGGTQERLDLAPAQIGRGRFREDPREGAAVPAVHHL